MILRLIIAATRWMWGVSPAFYSTPNPLTGGDLFVMTIGAFIDIIFALVLVPMVVVVVVAVAAAIKGLRRGGGEDEV